MNKTNTAHYIELLDPVRKTQEVFNSKWKLQIIIALLAGNSKFREIERSLPRISSKVLVKELRDLEESAIVRRTVYDSRFDVKYTIERNNRELKQLIAAYKDFSKVLSRRYDSDIEA